MADGRAPQPFILGTSAPQTFEAAGAQVVGRLLGTVLDAWLGNPQRMEADRQHALELTKNALAMGEPVDKGFLKKHNVDESIINALVSIQETPEWGINRAVGSIMGQQMGGIQDFVQGQMARPAGQPGAAWLPEVPLGDIDPIQAYAQQRAIDLAPGAPYGYPLPAAGYMYPETAPEAMETRLPTDIEVARRITQLSPAMQGLLRRRPEERVPYGALIEEGLQRVSMEKRHRQSYGAQLAQVAGMFANAGVFPRGTTQEDMMWAVRLQAGEQDVPEHIRQMRLENPRLAGASVKGIMDAQKDISDILHDWTEYQRKALSGKRRPKDRETAASAVSTTLHRIALVAAPALQGMDPVTGRNMLQEMIIRGGVPFWSQRKRAWVDYGDLLATKDKEDIAVANRQINQMFERASQIATATPLEQSDIEADITARYTEQKRRQEQAAAEPTPEPRASTRRGVGQRPTGPAGSLLRRTLEAPFMPGVAYPITPPEAPRYIPPSRRGPIQKRWQRR